jgi:hypothetical protein
MVLMVLALLCGLFGWPSCPAWLLLKASKIALVNHPCPQPEPLSFELAINDKPPNLGGVNPQDSGGLCSR